MKEKRPLKYLYMISACMVIVLCGWLCYKYIKGDKFDNVVKLDTTLNYTFDVSGTQIFYIELWPASDTLSVACGATFPCGEGISFVLRFTFLVSPYQSDCRPAGSSGFRYAAHRL